MATGDTFSQVRPADLFPVNAPTGYTPQLVTVGSGLRGVALRKLDTEVYYFLLRIPTTGTPLSTGLTFQVMLTESILGQDQDPGKNVYLGVTVKKLVSGNDDETDTGGGTETFVAVTLPATVGLEVVGSVAITTAAADTPVAGGFALVKVRRNGSNALDTHRRSVVLLGIVVSDT